MPRRAVTAAAITTAVALGALASVPVRAEPSPYAGQQERPIKALSAGEVADLLAGRGMGYAKAAELNGFPGPAHALELAGRLGLDAGQTQALAAVRDRMAAAARDLGASLVTAEGALDHRFASGQVDAATVSDLAGAIAALEGRLRAVHLNAHLETRAILSAEQARRYDELRGYRAAGEGDGPANRTGGHHSGHHRQGG